MKSFSLPLIVLLLVIIAVIYVSRRLSWAFSINNKIFTLIVALIMTIFIVSMITIMKTNMVGIFSHVMNNIANIGLGVMTILVCATIAVDIFQLIFKLHPLKYGLIIVSITFVLSLYSLWNAQHIRVYHREIDLPNLSQPLRIAHITDIHIGHFWGEKTVDKLVNSVLSEEVDAVVITGDMFDGRVRLNTEVIEPFNRLNVPIYFVEGNHDGYSGRHDIKNLLSGTDIKVLSNEIVEFNGLQIIGLNYLLADDKSVDTFNGAASRQTIESILPTFEIDRNKASVLLHHNPVGVKYVADNGINLYLAGHTHAGQLFPATLIAKIIFPYNKGLYRYNDDTQVYVSQGTGTFGPPMRLGTNSELTILELK